MQLEYSEAGKSRKLNTAAEVITGVILGACALAAFLSAMDIPWTGAFSGGPVSGLVNVWNAVADKLGSSNYIIITKYTSQGTGQVLFLALTLAVLAGLSCLAVLSRVRWLLLIYAVPFVCGWLFLGIGPGIPAGSVLAAALIMAYIVMGRQSTIGWPLLWELMIGMILTVALAAWINGTVTFSQPKFLEKAGTSVTTAVDKVRYGSNALEKGALNSLDGRKTGNGTALTVTMTRPQSMYLRGYVGEVYMGDRWDHLSNGTYYGARDKFYWLNRKGFSGLFQLTTAAKIGGYEGKSNKVTVKVGKADASEIYTPYEIAQGKVNGSESRADSYLGATGLTGNREYSYETSENMTGSWTDWVGRLYSQKETKTTDEYFVKESNYNVFEYEHYTGVPDDIRTLLSRETGYSGSHRQHMEYKEAIQRVRTYLKNNYVYSENFSAISADTDFLENFVRTRKGCDVHYATMATLMFRYYGIPARYVEGYLVTPDDVKDKAPGDAITISRNSIHAWTEIYIDGYGWVPVEVTPKYYGVMKEADLTRGLQSISYNEQLKKQKDPSQGAVKVARESSDKSKEIFLLLGKIVLLLALMALLIWLAQRLLRRAMSVWRRRKAFRDPDPRAAVCAMYGYILEEDIPVREAAHETGDYAAYSLGSVSENQRQFMSEELKRGKNEKKKRKRLHTGHSIGHGPGLLHRLRGSGRK